MAALRESMVAVGRKGSRSGFTLVELLVVIATIGILVSLLLPAVQSAREAARRTQCGNNLRQLALAVQNYLGGMGETFPPGAITPGPCCGTQSGTNWAISILPYLEEQALYDRYDFRFTNEDAVNKAVRESFLTVQQCPSEEDTNRLDIPESGPGADMGIPYARGSYRGNAGRSDGFAWWDAHQDFAHVPAGWIGPLATIGWEGGILGPLRLKQVVDGTSKTLLIGEMASYGTSASAVRRRTFWAYSYTSYNKSEVVPQTRTMLVDYTRCVAIGGPGDANPCKRAWGSYHPQGLQFAYCDGSVKLLNSSIDMELFAGMASIDGGEVATTNE